MVGEDLPALWSLLRPLHDLAASYPCPHSTTDGCRREVVSHVDGESVAVCQGEFLSCERLVLTKKDLVVYELDLEPLARALHQGLALEGPGASVGLARTRLVGSFAPAAGIGCPVYLSFPWGPLELLVLVERLALRAIGPFVLVVPTSAPLSADVVALLRTRGAIALALEDLTAVEGGRIEVLEESARAALASLHERLLEKTFAKDSKARRGAVLFPTPAGATWEELSIRFRDGQTVSVAVRDKRALLTYAQLGMARGTSSRPTLQWELLRQLAKRHGILEWKDPDASRNNQKRRERLAKDLKAFFRIEGDPIASSGNGWRCKFKLEPDSA
jgi:hypothetical protein